MIYNNNAINEHIFSWNIFLQFMFYMIWFRFFDILNSHTKTSPYFIPVLKKNISKFDIASQYHFPEQESQYSNV